MKKIMFVCTGNICRSAMAEKIFAKKVKEQGKEIEVYSAGTSADAGQSSTLTAISVMEDMGVDLTGHRATDFLKSNILEMDLVLCAGIANKMQVVNNFPEIEDKTYTIKEYIDGNPENPNIKDPWGYDISTYKACAEELEYYIDKILERI